VSVESACPACGRPRTEGDQFCAGCGRALEEQAAPADDVAPRQRGGILPSNIGDSAVERTRDWRAAQSPWLIGALVIATFNLYAMWWLGRTWWQLKQEDGDAGKHPVWHALAMLVPIYGYFRFYDHMRTIARIAVTPEARAILGPGAMTVAWIVINVLSGTAGTSNAPGWMLVLASVLCGALLGWAQHGLNATWRSLPGGAVSARAHPVHWLLLALGGLLYVSALLLPEPE
jgi:hypothetical protein